MSSTQMLYIVSNKFLCDSLTLLSLRMNRLRIFRITILLRTRGRRLETFQNRLIPLCVISHSTSLDKIGCSASPGVHMLDSLTSARSILEFEIESVWTGRDHSSQKQQQKPQHSDSIIYVQIDYHQPFIYRDHYNVYMGYNSWRYVL